MAYEINPGSFSLFKNLDKEQDNHPDYKGDGKDLQGRGIWVSAWIKEGKKGKFMSCTFKLKEQRAPAQKQRPQQPIDDDTPPF